MRGLCLVSLLATTTIVVCQAQPDVLNQPPQTARQALLEMFTGTKSGSFERHLPETARKALLKGQDAASSPMLREFASLRAGIAAGGKQLHTFDTGPILLSAEEVGQQKAEVYVERDDLLGDEDVIELSFRTYRNGEEEPLPVRPRLTFTMKEEKQVWRLNEITVAIHIPLADPGFLKDMKKTQNRATEASAVGNIRSLLTAEVSYSAANPRRGYTCKLFELGGSGNRRDPQHAMLIDPTLASGKEGEYLFSISGCDVPPSSKFDITATPADGDSGMRTFCATESGVIRFITEGGGEACIREGTPLQ